MPFLTSIGNNNTRLIASQPTFDPEEGWIFQEIYEGPEDSIKALMSTYALAGFRARAYPFEGPVWRAEFSRPPGTSETGAAEITDQWEIDTEFVQESLYLNANVVDVFGSDETLSETKKIIERTLDDRGTVNDFITNYQNEFNIGPSADQIELFVLRMRGQQATEVERTVLRRTRSISIQNGSRVVISATPNIYTSDALIAAFTIPADIQAAMPDDPGPAPSYTAWAWKKRRDTSVFVPQLNKRQETKDWVFSAWSTLTYNLFV